MRVKRSAGNRGGRKETQRESGKRVFEMRRGTKNFCRGKRKTDTGSGKRKAKRVRERQERQQDRKREKRERDTYIYSTQKCWRRKEKRHQEGGEARQREVRRVQKKQKSA